MKVYIAGPMTGIPDFNRPAFYAAERALAAAGHEPVSPVHADDLNADGSARYEWGWYMRRDLAELLTCEAIYCLPGWEASRGASLERHIADVLGMTVVEFEEVAA